MSVQFRRGSLFLFTFFLLASTPAGAEVQQITGQTRASVVEFFLGFPIQTDLGLAIVPLTNSEPPAVARARLDRLTTDNQLTAGGQAAAVLERPNVTAIGNPTDAGLDVAAFSDDAVTGWFCEGSVLETRTVRLTSADVNGEVGLGNTAHVKSRVLISGVMFLTAIEKGKDLTGTKVNFSFSVTLRQNGRSTTTPISGEVTLAGGGNASAQVQNPSGALANVILPIVDFEDQVPELPVARSVIFAGTDLPYEYDVLLDQPFDLELNVRAQVFSGPNGVGGAAVFGTPQEGLGSILSRVKGDDRGQKLQQAISRQVDTTGVAYANRPPSTGTSLLSFFPMCGVLGIEPVGLALFGGWVILGRAGRRSRRQRV